MSMPQFNEDEFWRKVLFWTLCRLDRARCIHGRGASDI